jgi:hypothetical protein
MSLHSLFDNGRIRRRMVLREEVRNQVIRIETSLDQQGVREASKTEIGFSFFINADN